LANCTTGEYVVLLDAVGSADVIEEARRYTSCMPIVLGVLCGMRRDEIAALRWWSIDLDAGQFAVVASTVQTKAGCREKDAQVRPLPHARAPGHPGD
jgi:integrase